MPLDPYMQKRAAKAQATELEIRAERGSESDFTEAKANVMAERVIDSGGTIGVTEPIDDETDSSLNQELIPPREESGLIDENIVLDESQVAAIAMLVQEQYGCMIGAAGSGKTTSQRFFLYKMLYGDEEEGIEPMRLRYLDGKQGLNIALVSFTGIATQVIKQNMPSWLHPACKTIHSLLEFAPVTTEVVKRDGELKESTVFMPMRDGANKLGHDLIIIDEASMVGIELWHQLLDACKPNTKIFLVGDLNQLPPVGSQSMFAYALSEYPVAELTHIHRQKEAAANRIIDVAHHILKGETFEFDDASTNKNWRVIGFKIDADPLKAGSQIVTIANKLREKRVSEEVDPDEPFVYDPYRDRIITAGNGFDENSNKSAIQQVTINEALSHLIQPPTKENPYIIIDAGMFTKRFSVGHRVMATRNESPSKKDRVTNGMVGIIRAIDENHGWGGDWSKVGPEDEVRENRKKALAELSGLGGGITTAFGEDDGEDDWTSEIDNIDSEDIEYESAEVEEENEREGGPASHRVTVEFVNGATRVFVTKAGVGSLMLAYASTCHKCQGSQFDTAVIVVHHLDKQLLSREWLYTAVTRAQKRVIMLYTDHGIRTALAKQRIFGQNLEEKIDRYRRVAEDAAGKAKSVRLYI